MEEKCPMPNFVFIQDWQLPYSQTKHALLYGCPCCLYHQKRLWNTTVDLKGLWNITNQQRRNVTTSMVGLQNGHICKNLKKKKKKGEPQRYSLEHRRRRRNITVAQLTWEQDRNKDGSVGWHCTSHTMLVCAGNKKSKLSNNRTLKRYITEVSLQDSFPLLSLIQKVTAKSLSFLIKLWTWINEDEDNAKMYLTPESNGNYTHSTSQRNQTHKNLNASQHFLFFHNSIEERLSSALNKTSLYNYELHQTIMSQQHSKFYMGELRNRLRTSIHWNVHLCFLAALQKHSLTHPHISPSFACVSSVKTVHMLAWLFYQSTHDLLLFSIHLFSSLTTSWSTFLRFGVTMRYGFTGSTFCFSSFHFVAGPADLHGLNVSAFTSDIPRMILMALFCTMLSFTRLGCGRAVRSTLHSVTLSIILWYSTVHFFGSHCFQHEQSFFCA